MGGVSPPLCQMVSFRFGLPHDWIVHWNFIGHNVLNHDFQPCVYIIYICLWHRTNPCAGKQANLLLSLNIYYIYSMTKILSHRWNISSYYYTSNGYPSTMAFCQGTWPLLHWQTSFSEAQMTHCASESLRSAWSNLGQGAVGPGFSGNVWWFSRCQHWTTTIWGPDGFYDPFMVFLWLVVLGFGGLPHDLVSLGVAVDISASGWVDATFFTWGVLFVWAKF